MTCTNAMLITSVLCLLVVSEHGMKNELFCGLYAGCTWVNGALESQLFQWHSCMDLRQHVCGRSCRFCAWHTKLKIMKTFLTVLKAPAINSNFYPLITMYLPSCASSAGWRNCYCCFLGAISKGEGQFSKFPKLNLAGDDLCDLRSKESMWFLGKIWKDDEDIKHVQRNAAICRLFWTRLPDFLVISQATCSISLRRGAKE